MRVTIPFDIRDFHALFYPPDMNMLGMEDFFGHLAKALREKHKAHEAGKYTPFLNKVIVDVASPETREVGVNELILSRLDMMSERIGRIEVSTNRTPAPSSAQARQAARRGTFDFTMPSNNFDQFVSELGGWQEVEGIGTVSDKAGVLQGKIFYRFDGPPYSLYSRFERVLSAHGGEMDVPF